MDTDKGLETETKVAEPVTSLQPEVKSPTAEELQVQIAELKVKYEQADKGVRTAQLTIAQRDKALKEQTDLRTELADLRESQKILAAIIAQQGTQTEGFEPEKKQDLLKVYEIKEAEIKQRRQVELTQQKQEEYNRQADTIYARAKMVFAGDDDSLERIEDNLTSGRLERAEARVVKAEGVKVKPAETKPTESEEAKIARLVEEGIRKKMEEKGLLVSDEGKPAGGGTTAQDAYAQYAKGKITAEEAKKRGATFS